jgi:hypothetical protein
MNVKPTQIFTVAAVILLLLLFFRFSYLNEELVETPLPSKESHVTPTPQPPSKEPDLRVTTRLSLSNIQPLYQSLQKRVEEYQTIQVRTRLEFPNILKTQVLEAEFWFDALRPDRYIHSSFNSQQEDKKDASSKYVTRPCLTETSDGKRMLVISHQRHNVHEITLDATDPASLQVVTPTKIKSATCLANPLQDLLFGMSYEDRLKELLEASRVKTSRGDEIQVLFRINSAMSKRIKTNQLALYLPIDDKGLALMSLRRDIFDCQTGDWREVVYLDQEWRPFLVQSYSQVTWNETIPEQRFSPEIPAGFSTDNINKILRRKRELGIKSDDLRALHDSRGPISATEAEEFIKMKERERK